MLENSILDFVRRAMSPVRYTVQPESLKRGGSRSNKVLAFCGISIDSVGDLSHKRTPIR